jgi:hypothetical protein
LFTDLEPVEPLAALPPLPLDEAVVQDYDALGLSLNAHPIGLVRDALRLHYEFTVYNDGQPPWRIGKQGQAGEWLADQSPPSAVLFVPGDGDIPAQMLIGSQVAEAGDGLAWTDLDGRKLRGAHGVGGAWTGAHFLTRDAGTKALPGVYAYSGSTWGARDPAKSELRLLALQRDGKSPAVVQYQFERDPKQEVHGWDPEFNYLGGIAAHDGVVLVSMPKSGRLLVVDAAAKRLLTTLDQPDVRGMAFDVQGRLLLLTGTRLLRAPALDWRTVTALPTFTILVERAVDGCEVSAEKLQRGLDQAAVRWLRSLLAAAQC